jgi:hypothetical protein
MPTKPTIKESTNPLDGFFRSRMDSMRTIQSGTVAINSAAKEESILCSAQFNIPFPPVQSKTPEHASTTSSLRVGRIDERRKADISSIKIPAIRMRTMPSVKGGIPDPGRTAMRMARYVLPQTI